MIEAGKLSHRVRFDRLTADVDSNGEVIQDATSGAVNRSWVPVITLWASIEPLSAREMILSRSQQQEYSGRLQVRYNRLVQDTTNLRAVHVVNGIDAVIFAIVGPALQDRTSGQEYLTFAVKTGMTQGE